MKIRELAISGAFEVTPQIFRDDRGAFLEWFRTDRFATHTGHPLTLAQANCSISRRGTLRGVHFSDVPPGQAIVGDFGLLNVGMRETANVLATDAGAELFDHNLVKARAELRCAVMVTVPSAFAVADLTAA